MASKRSGDPTKQDPAITRCLTPVAISSPVTIPTAVAIAFPVAISAASIPLQVHADV